MEVMESLESPHVRNAREVLAAMVHCHAHVCSLMLEGQDSGICNSGIGVGRNSRRTARPSHRAQRVDRATRALSLASPVFAYI
jgi:hypothetical protein